MLNPTYRALVLDQLARFRGTLGYIISHTDPDALRRYRDGGDGWTVQEVMGHLLDFEQVFLQRMQVVVETDNPELPFPDPDQLVLAGDYNHRDVQTVYQQWHTYRTQLHSFLSARAESDWARPARHPKRGTITLEEQLLVTAWHDLNHLEQITHILAERREAA
ncbi:MAG: DinB family protein [Chloroflexaceae bacterium]|nr:DinB family protein [Chloroflexaceae bacterium]